MNIHAPLTKKNWQDVKVLILGLGQYPQGSGISAAKAFAKIGAKVTVTDQKTEKDLEENVKTLKGFKNVRFVLGRHELKDVDDADLIVANPRVRPTSVEMKRARARGVPVVSDISLFLDRCPAKVIGVTGTRGKSTTVTLIAEMLKASKKKVWLGGNILVSPLNFLSKIKKDDIVVLELSSWQCESLGMTVHPPQIALMTNLMRDHLNTYDGMDDYAEAKAQIFRHQKPEDILILNGDDAWTKIWKKEAPSQVLTFGKGKRFDAGRVGDSLVLDGKAVCTVKDLKIFGEHNILNALGAMLVAKQGGATVAGIKKALKSFTGLPNRQEIVRSFKGVDYINDTTATTPDGTIAAIRALKDRYGYLWMICGGEDKELEYSELAKELVKQKKKVAVFLLPGSSSEKLMKLLSKKSVLIERVPDLKTAVLRAHEKAVEGDAIVLSPGATSFGQFKNEFDRGEQFVSLVRRLK